MPQGMFEIPNIATVLATTTEIATPVFVWMLPTALYFLGLVLGSMVLYWLIGVITDSVGALFDKRRELSSRDEYLTGRSSVIDYFRYRRIDMNNDD